MSPIEVCFNLHPQLTNKILNTTAGATTIRNLNDLPNEILLHNLSFLPTLNSVRTALVSQSRIPSMNFICQHFPPYKPPFVDHALLSRSDYPVHTFRLSFPRHSQYCSCIDS
ncbi:hypothetical protein TB2_023020 [Malus domestica]